MASVLYCIVENGKQELDKLLDNTRSAILCHKANSPLHLEKVKEMFAECERLDRLDKLVANVLYSAMNDQQWGNNPLDKAFWRVNLSK